MSRKKIKYLVKISKESCKKALIKSKTLISSKSMKSKVIKIQFKFNRINHNIKQSKNK
jgi:hypothetical protein